MPDLGLLVIWNAGIFLAPNPTAFSSLRHFDSSYGSIWSHCSVGIMRNYWSKHPRLGPPAPTFKAAFSGKVLSPLC